jgi:uncharacterized protein (TIGR02246 family)
MERSDLRRELEAVQAEWNRAWLEKDAAAADRLMAAECVYIAANGLVVGREELLEVIRSPRFHIDEGSRTEARVVAIGEESAVVADRWRGSGTLPDGGPFRDDHRCTFVWARRAGRWQLLLEQCTPIAR